MIIEYHEVANIFPLIQYDEYELFKKDIEENGLLEPIDIYQDKIIDGRNRYRACLDLDIEPIFNHLNGQVKSPLEYVISKNLHRRHLNESQRAVIASRLANMQLGDNQYKSGSANLPTLSQPEAAKILNISPRILRTVKAIEHESPELIEKIINGETTVNKAIRDIKRTEILKNLESIEAKEIKAINGIYDVIVIDPPWPMKRIERDVSPTEVGFDYPTMTIEEIKALKVPTADNCHVFLWTTQKYLPFALEILKGWNLIYVCTFVWHKPGGFQPWNLPQYNCEFCLYAHKGAPIFTDAKKFMACFNADRGKHSEKPKEFYDLIRRVTAGRRLNMFSRKQIDGFDGWGNEAK